MKKKPTQIKAEYAEKGLWYIHISCEFGVWVTSEDLKKVVSIEEDVV
jgi:hypothetical protein